MRSLNDYFCSFRQRCHRTSPGDHGKGFCFILWETAHPLVENSGNCHFIITILFQVFFRKLFQNTKSRYILNQVSALPISYGNIFHTLLCRQHSLDNSHRIGHRGRYQRTGQRSVGLSINRHPCFFIDTCQTVYILPVIDGSFQWNIFGIWNVIGNSAAFVAGKASRVTDFCKKTGVRGAMAYLHRNIQIFDDLPASVYSMIYSGKTIQHGLSGMDRLFNPFFRLFVTVLPGIRVDGSGQKIRFSFILKILKKFYMFVDQSHTGSWLDQGPALFFGCRQFS